MRAWDEYKVIRNNRNKVAKHCKQSNIINDLKAKSVKNDLKGIWKTIKLASNINPNVSSEESVSDGNPDNFNSHFATIGSCIQTQVPQFDNISFSDFLQHRESGLAFDEFEEVTGDSILAYVKSLPRDKAVFMKYHYLYLGRRPHALLNHLPTL